MESNPRDWVTKTQKGFNEDGSPHWHYDFNGPEGSGMIHAGGATGVVSLSDGSVYRLDDELIPHHPGHAGPLSHHIAILHERAGTLRHIETGELIRHECSDFCGDEKDSSRVSNNK